MHIVFSVSYFKCRREFQESLPIKSDFLTQWIAKHKLSRPIEIRQSSRISAPLTYGVFKPIILMPKSTNWDDTKQIEYILAHEFVHVRRFDAATKLFLTTALCVHWFNPLVWAMYVLSNRDIELSCDETVVRSFGNATKSAYALTLISMEEKKNTLTPLCNNFSKNAIEERITSIMKMKKTSLASLFVAFLLVGSVTTVFATSALAKSPEQISFGVMETTIVENEIYYLVNTENDLMSIGDQHPLSGNYILANDIVLTGEWQPIGNQSEPFTGRFDGNGFIIDNLTVTKKSDNLGFFGGSNGAIIKNLVLNNVHIKVSDLFPISFNSIDTEIVSCVINQNNQ